MSFIPLAHAAGEAAAKPTGAMATLMQFAPMIVIFVIFYFLLIRPQQKKAKQHQAMINSLGKGAKIITTGGVVGTIVKVEDQFMDIEISEGVVIKQQRSAITGTFENSVATPTK